MYGYFANKSKHRLIVKNIYKKMAIYLKNRIIIVTYLNSRLKSDQFWHVFSFPYTLSKQFEHSKFPIKIDNQN